MLLRDKHTNATKNSISLSEIKKIIMIVEYYEFFM